MRNVPDYSGMILGGTISPLVKARVAGEDWQPTRPLGGWVMVYALRKADGGLVPVVDRDDQIIEAAAAPDRVDVTHYLRKGRWNDTHRRDTTVGIPTELEWHGADSDLAKAHGKVGWWTAGHLFDRDDPASWEAFNLDRPSEPDLQRADHFWRTAALFKGSLRPLGFSAEGRMRLSPDRKRIVWAELTDAAVCELPVNPATTAEPLDLLKAITAGSSAASLVPEDLEGSKASRRHQAVSALQNADPKRVEQLVTLIQRRNGISASEARRMVKDFMRTHVRQTEAS